MDTTIAIFKSFVYLIGFGSILFLTYITTRFIGTRANKTLKGKYISTVDTMNMGLNKQLHLIKVGEQFLLIASTGKGIEFLTSIKLDNYEVEKELASQNVFDFKNFFDKYMQSFKNKKDEKAGIEKVSDIIEDSSKNEVFKSNLNKIRAIASQSKMKYRDKEDGDEKTDEK